MMPSPPELGPKAGVSPWQGLVSVLTDPANTFASLAARAPVLSPYLAQTAAALIGVGILYKNLMALSESQLANAPAGAADFARVVMNISIFGGALVTPWLAGLVLSAIALLVGQFLGGGVSFRQWFSMLGYARMPLALGGLLQAVIASRVPPEKIQSVSISLAALVPEANPMLKGFLTTLNPFDFWYLALAAIGSGVLLKTETRRGAVLSAIFYILGLAMALIGVMFSASTQMAR